MCEHNFRVKLDLCKFYEDVRRSSWVYVDTGSISCICHLQKHITKIFEIQNAFHLLLNTGEYLPPNEDVRILKEDDTIRVIPGTGLQKTGSNADVQMDAKRHVSQQKRSVEDSILVPNVKANESSDGEDEASNFMGETTGDNTVFLSMINDSQIESASETKPEINSLEESLVLEISPMKNKRKRVRRRKSRSNFAPEDQPVPNGDAEAETKKPKIINSVTIPNGKHIRFGDVEKVEFQGYDSSVSNDSRKNDSKSGKNGTGESYWEKPAAGANLANLLALGQSSTPITFGRKKNAPESQPESNNGATYETEETAREERRIFKRDNQVLNVDPKKHPLMENKARVNDLVAFKMLKMGNDYTPQVSEYVTAHPIEILADKSTYVFKILGGKDEIQAPQGKFELETDETENTETDIVTLNWSQLIEPRLIYRE